MKARAPHGPTSRDNPSGRNRVHKAGTHLGNTAVIHLKTQRATHQRTWCFFPPPVHSMQTQGLLTSSSEEEKKACGGVLKTATRSVFKVSFISRSLIAIRVSGSPPNPTISPDPTRRSQEIGVPLPISRSTHLPVSTQQARSLPSAPQRPSQHASLLPRKTANSAAKLPFTIPCEAVGYQRITGSERTPRRSGLVRLHEAVRGSVLPPLP